MYTCCVFTCSRFVHFVYMYNVNFYSHHVQGDKTPLHCAAERGHTEVVKYLLENTTVQVNAKDKVSHGYKGLFCANKNCPTKYNLKLWSK